MRKVLIVILVPTMFFFSLLILPSCATTTYNLIPKNYSDEKETREFYSEGRKVLIQKSDETALFVSGGRTESHLTLDILYKNLSNNPIDVFPEKITVIGIISKKNKQVELRVLSPSEYLA